MSQENWHRGYQEVRNVIHNEMGITKEEILEIFRQIAKDELQKIVSEKSSFIYQTIREVIRDEMIHAVKDHRYPKIKGDFLFYTNKNSFEDYVAGVMKEEIIDYLKEQFELKVNIKNKEN